MQVKREMVMDLLPLYLADEVSAETRAIIDEYLKGDEELRKMVQDTKLEAFNTEVPVPLNKEGMMEAYRQARRYMFLRSVGVTLIICVTLLLLCGMFFMAVVWTNHGT
jgi:hypothetical protein